MRARKRLWFGGIVISLTNEEAHHVEEIIYRTAQGQTHYGSYARKQAGFAMKLYNLIRGIRH